VAGGLGDHPQPVGGGHAQRSDDRHPAGLRISRPVDLDLVQSGDSRLQAAQGFLQALGEGAADGHHLAHRLHLGGQMIARARIFLEGEARDLGDHIIQRWLEGGGGRAGDVVGQLVEGVADGQLGGDLGDRKSRSPWRPGPRIARRAGSSR